MPDQDQAAQIAAAVIAEAHQTAEKVVERATKTAENVLNSANVNQNAVDAISESLRKVFGENVDAKRFIDVTRVPLICQNIMQIHQNLEEIKKNMVSQEAFWPVKTIVYSGAGIILTAVFTALVYLVVKR